MAPRESALEERLRHDAEKAAANLERQVRQGVIAVDPEVKDEASESKPKSRSRSKSK